ncbi:MAG: hypothetical protein ACE366_19195 [Bradymonadia bacterium]
MLRWSTLGAVVLMLALVGAGCGGAKGPPPDDDSRRDLAKPMPMNKVFTDSLTFSGKDKNDWKLINVEEPGLLYVTVRFDEINAACRVHLADKYGAKIAREDNAGQPRIEMVREVNPGRFFIWLEAVDNSCSSQYSIEARLDPSIR